MLCSVIIVASGQKWEIHANSGPLGKESRECNPPSHRNTLCPVQNGEY